MVNGLEEIFPGLVSAGYTVTSPRSKSYNCIAWAAGDLGKWWWPTPADDVFWPLGASRTETLVAFREAFASIGYVKCSGQELEPGFEKIAIFASEQGVPLHAARQLSKGDGRASSVSSKTSSMPSMTWRERCTGQSC
jgi:hypothetical protein